jgi:hypothetical protein
MYEVPLEIPRYVKTIYSLMNVVVITFCSVQEAVLK